MRPYKFKHIKEGGACVAALALLLFSLVICPLMVAADGPAAEAGEKLCTATAKAVRSACFSEAKSEVSIMIGNCNNLATASARENCKKQAQQELRDLNDECEEQFAARRDICKDLGEDAYNPVIDPARFTSNVTNPFFPLTPGVTRIYRGGNEVVTVTVTDRTKPILGVSCVVVRDVVTVNGVVVEDTEDYFAQDVEGNVWYFGEVSQEFEDGELVSLDGSFKAGVKGAKPGIMMKANPRVGDLYRQEFLLNEAEDLGQVLSLTGSATVPAASCSDCLVTKDFTPLEPDSVENKFYARGIGTILEVDVDSGKRVELVEIRRR